MAQTTLGSITYVIVKSLRIGVYGSFQTSHPLDLTWNSQSIYPEKDQFSKDNILFWSWTFSFGGGCLA